jgi:hypothetical protein
VPRILRRTIGSRRWLAAIVAGAAVAALTPTAAEAEIVTMNGSTVSILPMGSASSGVSPSTQAAGTNLIDHGGFVLPADHTYLIFWGTQSKWPSDVFTGLPTLFGGFNGSPWLSIAAQYMRHANVSSSYVSTLTDTSAPPTSPPSTAAIVNEVTKVLGAHRIAASPSAVYFVYTSNFPSQNSFCAWHGHGKSSGVDIAVAYMPNTTGLAGCDPGNLYHANSYSQGTRSLANVSSHEFMEVITDKDLNAWFDSSGSEIGDKCAWRFSAPVPLSNGSKWQLQEEWSNAVTGCLQN